MKISPKQYALSLYESVKDKSEKEIKQIVGDFVKILIAGGNISKFEKIIAEFNAIWNREQGIVEAEIISANGLDEETRELLEKYIGKLSGAKKVETIEKQDKSLLGGVVLKYGDKILDGSLKAKLNLLKNDMKK